VLWFNYDRVDAGFQYEQIASWFPSVGSSYHVGLDGISLAMFLLTTILTPLAILASFDIEKNPKMFMALFLLMESAMLGLFASLDLLIFFVFGSLAWCPCIS
jgi:NADH-quinone oxidoreductase subunit M